MTFVTLHWYHEEEILDEQLLHLLIQKMKMFNCIYCLFSYTCSFVLFQLFYFLLSTLVYHS